MTTTLRSAWEDRGVTDPAIMYRLTDVGIDIEHFDGHPSSMNRSDAFGRVSHPSVTLTQRRNCAKESVCGNL